MSDRDSYQRMEEAMGTVLRTGVALCCAIMLAGGVALLVRHGGEHTSYARFHGEPAPLTSIRGVFAEAMKGSAAGIIQAGALLMIATPIMRVIFAVAGFAKLRDWKFAAISLCVLGLLILGFNK